MAYYGEPTHPSYEILNTPEMRAKYGWGASGGVKNFTIYETSPVNQPSQGFQLGYQVDYMDRSVPVLWNITPEQAKQFMNAGLRYQKITAPMQIGDTSQGYWSSEGKLPASGYPEYIPSITPTAEAQPYSPTMSTPFMDYFYGQKSGGSTPTQILQNWAKQQTPSQAPSNMINPVWKGEITWENGVPKQKVSPNMIELGGYTYTPPPAGLDMEQTNKWNQLESIKKNLMGLQPKVEEIKQAELAGLTGGVGAGGAAGSSSDNLSVLQAIARAAGIEDVSGITDERTLQAQLIAKLGTTRPQTALMEEARTKSGLEKEEAEYTAAEKEVLKTEALLDTLEQRVNQRISGRMVTEAQRQRMLVAEQKPLRERLATQTREAQIEQADVTSKRELYNQYLTGLQAEEAAKLEKIPQWLALAQYETPAEKAARERETYRYQQEQQQKYATPKEASETEKRTAALKSVSDQAASALEAEKGSSEDKFANPDTYRKWRKKYIDAGGTSEDWYSAMPITTYIHPKNRKSDLRISGEGPDYSSMKDSLNEAIEAIKKAKEGGNDIKGAVKRRFMEEFPDIADAEQWFDDAMNNAGL